MDPKAKRNCNQSQKISPILTLATTLSLWLLVTGCFSVSSDPPLFQQEETDSVSDTTIPDTGSESSTGEIFDTDSESSTGLPCVCEEQDECCDDGCHYNDAVSECDDSDPQTIDDRCGSRLPCAGVEYCEDTDNFCFRVAPTYQEDIFDNLEQLEFTLRDSDSGACAATDYCGQDAQYESINQDRHFSTHETVASQPYIRDSLTGLNWVPHFALTPDSSPEEPRNYCAGLNDQDYGGLQGWRLPSVYELTTIVDFGTLNPPTIDTSVFPDALIDSDGIPDLSGSFYTSTPDAGDTDGTFWTVHFGAGYTFSAEDSDRVRCVRNSGSNETITSTPQLPKSDLSRFAVLNGGGDTTLLDRATLLEWQKADLPKCTWATALSSCEDSILGGHDDWRVPNINELSSLIVYDKATAPVASLANMNNEFYWSSTTVSASVYGQNPYAWTVDFSTGDLRAGIGLKETQPGKLISFCTAVTEGENTFLPQPATGCIWQGTCCRIPEQPAAVLPVRCVRGSGRGASL